MIYEYRLTVRGYELDSYNHVNHAVYLNYLEQARWEILKYHNLLDYFKGENFFLVVIDINIHFSKEIKIFDELLIKTEIVYDDIYINFIHKIYNLNTDIRVCKAMIKTLIINNEKIPIGIPEELLNKMGLKQ